MNLPSYGITIDNHTQTSLRLSGNNSAPNNGNVFGYLLNNFTNQFLVQSPNLALSGVQSLNVFPINTTGTIFYVPYLPP